MFSLEKSNSALREAVYLEYILKHVDLVRSMIPLLARAGMTANAPTGRGDAPDGGGAAASTAVAAAAVATATAAAAALSVA